MKKIFMISTCMLLTAACTQNTTPNNPSNSVQNKPLTAEQCTQRMRQIHQECCSGSGMHGDSGHGHGMDGHGTQSRVHREDCPIRREFNEKQK